MGPGLGRPDGRRGLRCAALAGLLVAAAASVASWTGVRAEGAPGENVPWQPEPAIFGVGQSLNLPVTMADGTVLRADVYVPTDRATGRPAEGPFPVLLTQTPYGKSQAVGGAAGVAAGAETYLVQRGYVDVVADVRGTGDSGGTWGLFDPVEQRDGATLVRWAARLPHADGRVGLYGPSYLGIDQFLTAAALGPGSPLRAMLPEVAGNDLYRDSVTMGGIPDGEFNLFYLALTASLNTTNPLLENPGDVPGSLRVLAQHERDLLTFHGPQLVDGLLNGKTSYDGPYWWARDPWTMLAHVAALRIPTLLVGGWFDLFQRGEPLDYAGLQNAAAGRPVTAPMVAGQPVSSRYQLLMGPWYHVTAGSGVDMDVLRLRWFDRWLKGEDTGVDATRTPLHLYELGADRWVDAGRYPFDGLAPATLYLGPGRSGSGSPSDNDGTLTWSPPPARTGADPVVAAGAGGVCGRQTEQWSMGALSALLAAGGLPSDPCTVDDRLVQAGPGALTYTTEPLAVDTVVGGPIDVTVFATSTRPEVELEATVEDVSPGGRSTPLTSGALLGSFRAVDASRSWMAADGRPLLPYHPYTRESQRPVPVGEVTRYDIEVFPTFARLAAGHRLRVTLTTADTPHLVPTAGQLAGLAGGIDEVQRRMGAASFVEIPMAPASRVPMPPSTLVPPAAARTAGAGPTTAPGEPPAPAAGMLLAPAVAAGARRTRRRRRGAPGGDRTGGDPDMAASCAAVQGDARR
jgi:uncharacterized protein